MSSPKPERGLPSVSPEEGIKLLSEQISKAKLLPAPIEKDDFRKWKNTTLNYVELAFGVNHRNISEFDQINYFIESGRPRAGGWVSGGSIGNVSALTPDYVRRLNGMIKALEGYIEQLNARSQIRGPNLSANTELASSKRIFIVHGHDGELKEATARLVLALGLEPIILHEQSNQGRTIIEKFTDHAKEAGFAIVLLSADDEGRSRKGGNPLIHRARQNVVFELGFFFGSLGPERICAIHEEGIELPSDVYGYAYTEYNQGGKWKYDLAKELQKAGYEVDMNTI